MPLRDGVTEAEALVTAEDSALTRFANSEIHQNVAETNVSINLRVVVGKRVGVASTGRTDDEGLRRLAEQPRAIARVVEELDDWGGLPGPTDRRRPSRPPTARPPPRRRPEFRAEARPRGHRRRRRGRRRRPTARSRPASRSIAVANSKGARAVADADDRPAHHRLDGPGRRDRLRRGGGRGRLDHRRRGARPRGGRQGARDRRTPVSVEPGDYPVVLEEYAVVDLLDMLGYLGFSALAVQEERQLRRARQADRQRPRDDRRRRLRPGRPAAPVRLRGRRQAARLARRARASAATSSTTPRPRRGPASLHRPRPAGPEPVGPVPAQHGHGAGTSTARRPDRRAWIAACS